MSSRKGQHHSSNKARPPKPTVAATKWCTGCSACQAVCSKRHAITMQEDAEGFLYPKVDQARCNHCGKCYRHCPSAQLEQGCVLLKPGRLAPLEPHTPAPTTPPATSALASAPTETVPSDADFKPRYFALSLKPDYKSLYGCATTGAAFRISYAFLKEGGIVCGCRFNYESCEAEHALATSVDELTAFCGSKYVQSNKHDVMAQIRELLAAGRKVLFIGTPCEVAGLKQLLSASEQAQLFTIDLICHGVPDPQSLKLYLNDLKPQIGELQDLNFRADHWEPLIFSAQGANGGVKEAGNHTHYFFAFMQNLHLRPSCYHCPYAALTRVGDLTLGDFWGVSNLIKDFPYPEAGVSAAIISNAKGVNLINTLHHHTRTVCEVSAEVMQATNGSLRQAATTVQPARELYYRERARTHSVIASVNAVIAQYGKQG